jgi:hypothetical protein
MKTLPKTQFLAGFLIASLIFGTSAIAISVQNTPETGYLLCYNTSTKTIIYPGTLKCPKGTKGLELGSRGQDGLDGADGLDGESPYTYAAYIADQDVVVTNSSDGKRFVVLKLSDLVGDVAEQTEFLAEAQVDITFEDDVDADDMVAWCSWRKSKDWRTTNEYFGSFGSSTINGNSLSTSTQIMARAYLSLISNTDDLYLTCTMFGSGSVTGGFVTAQQIRGEFKDTIGG